MHRFERICERLTRHLLPDTLTSCAGDTPASHSASPASAVARRMSGIYGRTLLESLANAAPPYVFSRTSRGTLFADSGVSTTIWSEWVTRLRQGCLRRRKSALRTGGSGCLSWQWPTAQAHDVTLRGNTEADHHYYPHDLVNAAASWPTPKRRDWKGGKGATIRQSPDLDKVAEHGFPSSHPAPETSKPGGESSTPTASFARLQAIAGSGRKPYDKRAKRILMRMRADSFSSWRLNPAFVSWLMGWPEGQTGFGCSETELSRWRRRMRSALCGLLRMEDET